MVMSYYKTGIKPWDDIAISGHILLRKGEKISKRTGGGSMRPEDEINKHSADAIRWAMCGSALGLDAYYDEKELQNGKRLVNKLWNASNFIEMVNKDFILDELEPEKLEKVDRWVVAEAAVAAKEAARYFEKYDYAHARERIEEFFWGVFCDVYLEMIKRRVYESDGGDQKKQSAQNTLWWVMLDVLKMFSPFVPHITEEIFQRMYSKEGRVKSIHLAVWPKREFDFDGKVMAEVIKIIELFRGEKSRQGV